MTSGFVSVTSVLELFEFAHAVLPSIASDVRRAELVKTYVGPDLVRSVKRTL